MTTQGHQTARRSDHVAEAPSAWGRSVFGEVRNLTMSDADVRDIFASVVPITGDPTPIVVFADDDAGVRVLLGCEEYEVDR